ncbi:hypothetical protein [Prauserella alba]|uniref:DUF4190 domain-containing protein n=1 Tax=Prauserella alba TaxID=176898 RepID=A0ABN1VD85_9PSEU|nr:hypothetical protein [Prauserella alba]MCP2179326.1 hypothetical protein [Prauserella alba]
MNTNPQHPGTPYSPQSAPYPPTSQPTGGQAQPSPSGGGFATLAGAALLTFACGMAVLIGYLMIGSFGAIIGIFGAIFGVVWLAGVHGGKVFPREGFPTKSLGGLAAASAVLLALAAAMT